MEDRDILLQETYAKEPNGPWKVLVTCMTLNRTTWMQAEPALIEIFKRWPSPITMASMNQYERDQLRIIMQPLGFGEMRTRRVIHMSQQFVAMYGMLGDQWEKYIVKILPGIGDYGSHAWDLFVLKRPCNPIDARLKWYAEKVGLLKEK